MNERDWQYERAALKAEVLREVAASLPLCDTPFRGGRAKTPPGGYADEEVNRLVEFLRPRLQRSARDAELHALAGFREDVLRDESPAPAQEKEGKR